MQSQKMQINYTTATVGNIVAGESALFVPPQQSKNSLWCVPPHQRHFVWTPLTQAKLIDTLINGYPIPAIVVVQRLALSTSGAPQVHYEIEDGQQRLTTMYRFINNQFSIPIGDDLCYYKDLEDSLRLRFLNFQVPLIQIVFDNSTSQYEQDNIITDIFLRLQSGTPLSDGDKYYASTNAAVMRNFNEFYENFNASIIKYIGKVGTNKTRSGLSEICGSIMTLGHQNPNLLRRSFKENYSMLTIPFTHTENIEQFFQTYFELLDRVVPAGKTPKIYGKISGFLGYAVLEYITHKVDATRVSFPSSQLAWYLKKILNDKDHVPTTFNSLSSAHQRNNGPESISARLSAIKTAYINEHAASESDSDSD